MSYQSDSAWAIARAKVRGHRDTNSLEGSDSGRAIWSSTKRLQKHDSVGIWRDLDTASERINVVD
jgi:hypothetical protein